MELIDFGPILHLALNILEDAVVLMLYFQELYVDFPFQPVREVVIEWVSQCPVDQLLYQFDQPVFLELIILPQFDVDIFNFVGDFGMGII